MYRLFLALLLLMPATAGAVRVGDTKAEVLTELGKPTATLGAGNREFLSYEGGRIELTDGVVTAFRGKFQQLPVPTDPAPSDPAEEPAPEEETSAAPFTRGLWFTDFQEALEEAENADKRVLALFTGSDWCPPCQKFEAEVAHDEQFATIFSPYFVFYKCDWLRNTPQPPEVAAEVDRMKAAYDIDSFPTLKVLDSQGEELDEVDWTGTRAQTFKGVMMKAIDDSRIATTGNKKAKSSWWPF